MNNTRDTLTRRHGLALACLLAHGTTALAQTVVVTGERDAYAARESSSATRTETPIERIPQSVNTVTRRVIDDQGAQNPSEAVRNVSNTLGFDARDANNGGAFRVRGFDAAVVMDGIALPGFFATPESLVGVRRIDVVKGPAGTLFGGSQAAGGPGFVGGVVSIATVSPIDTPLYEGGLRIGTESEAAAFFDLNQPLGQTTGLRFAGELYRTDTETDFVRLKRVTLLPSFSWRPSTDSELLLRLRYSDNQNVDFSGLPARGTVVDAPYTVPRSRNLTATGIPETSSDTLAITASWKQRIDDIWSWNLLANWTRATLDQRGVFPFPFAYEPSLPIGPDLDLLGARLYDRFESTSISPMATARFPLGDTRHELSFGLDWSRTTDDAYLRFSPNPFFPGYLGSVNVTLPQYPQWAEPDTTGTPDQQNSYRTTAYWLQDQVQIGPVSLLGSVRYTRFDIDDVNPLAGIDSRYDLGKTTGRLGATWQIDPAWSAFVGWGQGIRMPVAVIFTEAPKPEESTQTEIGVRWRTADLAASLAVFDLELKNALVADPVNIGQSLQVGEQRSRGVDIDFSWQPRSDWRVLLNASWQNPEVTQDPLLQGKQLFNIPKTTARAYANHDIGRWAEGLWSAGLGVTYTSELPGDSANNFFTPSSTVWDAQLAWRGERATVQLVVRNLFDNEYFVPSQYFGGGQVLPAAPRLVSLNASFKF
jgi:iron complex outermembrane receptor protein